MVGSRLVTTEMLRKTWPAISVMIPTDDGEDEIVLRLGKKELFLAALAEAHAEETA